MSDARIVITYESIEQRGAAHCSRGLLQEARQFEPVITGGIPPPRAPGGARNVTQAPIVATLRYNRIKTVGALWPRSSSISVRI